MNIQEFVHGCANNSCKNVLNHHLLYNLLFFNRSTEGPKVEPRRGPVIFWRGVGYLCPSPTETVQCFVATVADAWTHGPHPSALHDPQYMHQHLASAPHHADRTAAWWSFPVQRHPCGQRFGDTPHDSVLHPRIWTFRRRGDQSTGTYCRRTAHLHTGC